MLDAGPDGSPFTKVLWVKVDVDVAGLGFAGQNLARAVGRAIIENTGMMIDSLIVPPWNSPLL